MVDKLFQSCLESDWLTFGNNTQVKFSDIVGRNIFPSHLPHYQNEYIKNIENSQDLIDALGIINAP